jgi:hypothetical protein
LAKLLTPLGIAVARFDRRIMEGGDDVPFELQVEDAMRIVAELEADSRIDSRRIGMWGYSQGAWVAPLAASRSSKIRFLILLASTGVSPSEQMLYGTATHARMAGFGDSAAERIVAVRRTVDEHRRGHVTLAHAQAAVDSIRNEPFFEHAWTPADLSGLDLTWRDMDFDPEPVLARVRVPTLLFYGEDDEWSPIDESIAVWRRAAKVAKNEAVTIVRLPGTKHSPTIGGEERMDAISPDYERALLDWVARATRLGVISG